MNIDLSTLSDLNGLRTPWYCSLQWTEKSHVLACEWQNIFDNISTNIMEGLSGFEKAIQMTTDFHKRACR